MTTDKNIFIKNIYYMLTYAFRELRENKYEYVAGEDFEDIFNLFAEILIKGISFQLKQGLHREYIERKEAISTFRGKLDVNGTLNHYIAHKPLLFCEYDELSEDNIFNRILKSTVSILLSNETVTKKRKGALRRLMPFFSGVSDIDFASVQWHKLQFDRNCKNYQMLLYLCYFIVSEMLPTTEQGKFKMRTLSDERMNMLFERFVLEYYRRHHPELHAEAKQIGWNINKTQSDTSHLPILQTDVLLHLDGRMLIIDTKYIRIF